MGKSDMAVTLSTDTLNYSGQVDVQDLILSVMLQRSNIVYEEMKSLTTVMQNRNKELTTLGSLLATLQKQLPSDQKAKGKDISKISFTDPATGKTTTLEAYYKAHSDLLPDKVSLTDATYSDVQSLITAVSSRQDQLNNDSQADTLRVQSMTNAYNKCFDMASNVLSKSSNTQGGIIANIK